MSKGSLFRALTASGRLDRETAKKKLYAKHYKKAGPKYAMTYANWLKKGRGSTEAQLRESHTDVKRFNKNK